MYIDNQEFESWMKRIWEKLESLENKITGKEKVRYTINGETLLDNQDLCFMLNVSKRTLQRFRSSGFLPYKRINQKLYYLESDVLQFIKEHLKQGNKSKQNL
jgi:hypothetical protein